MGISVYQPMIVVGDSNVQVSPPPSPARSPKPIETIGSEPAVKLIAPLVTGSGKLGDTFGVEPSSRF